MLAHVVARDMFERARQMRVGRVGERRPARIAVRQRPRERALAPRAAQVQAVEVRDLAVGAVGDGGGREERRRLARGERRQERVEPREKLGRRQHAPHQLRLHQRRRQEFVAARLPRLTVRVAQMPAPRGVDDQRLERRMPGLPSEIERERQRERGVEVRADAQRIGCLRQEFGEALDEEIRERRERRRPAAGRVGFHRRQLRG
ncbi:hypothetical protein DP56_5942 [Burkholderia pseudomallei]|nr:hypothetical protein DP56_5942 [Burkholderia pseudomallei]